MYILKRTTSDNLDFQNLVSELDKNLAKKNGDTNNFFAQYNKLDSIKHVIVAYDPQGVAVGCGAMKEYSDGVVELKRMFVSVAERGRGIAGKVLIELQLWAEGLGYKKCILETGDKMIEAIGLYKKHQFHIIPNYGQYADVDSSICFEKKIG